MAAGGEPGAPPPPERPYVEAAASAPAKLRVALSTKPVRAAAPPIVTDEVKRGVRDAEDLLRSLGHDVAEHDPAYGLAGNNVVPRYLGGIHEDVRGRAQPRAPRGTHAGLRAPGLALPGGVVRRAREGRGEGRTADQRTLRRLRRAHHAGRRRGRLPGRPLGGQGRPFGPCLAMARSFCFGPIWNHTGQPAAAVPIGFTDDGLPRSVAARRPAEPRGPAALPRRPDRGREALGGPPPAGLLTSATDSRSRPRARSAS